MAEFSFLASVTLVAVRFGLRSILLDKPSTPGADAGDEDFGGHESFELLDPAHRTTAIFICLGLGA